ncbi:MAG: DUF1080 domain-containing protein, partial [Lentisphaerae bacterium]|nr:DUF1080 domain-containing protein [Lentisphaerota bacterium]
MAFPSRSTLASLVLLVCSHGLSADADRSPKSSTYKIHATPDLRQRTVQRELGLRGWCAPTAISDTLMWLGRNGYPRLIPKARTSEEAHIKLAARLGSMEYMETVRGGGGTTRYDLADGVVKYVLEQGYTVQRLEIDGLYFPPGAQEGKIRSQLRALKSAIHDRRTVVWWHLKKARPDQAGKLELYGGHYVCVVGYIHDREGQDEEITLVIHDPGNRKQPEGQYIQMVRLVKALPGMPAEWVGHYVGVGKGWGPAAIMSFYFLRLGVPYDRRTLFNGRDLTGWTPIYKSATNETRVASAAWPVRDGTIVCESEATALLVSGAKYGDFDLTFDVRMRRGGATAVLVRSDLTGAGALPIPLLDRVTLRKASADGKGGALAGVLATIAAAMRPDRWNTVEIRCDGDRVQLTINAREIVDLKTSRIPELRNAPSAGHIVLLSKDGAGNGTAYRNFRIRDRDGTGSVAAGRREAKGSPSRPIVPRAEVKGSSSDRGEPDLAARIDQLARLILRKADQNSDGRLTRMEFAEKDRPNFGRVDANRDGRVNATEFAAFLGSGINALFSRLDRDGNGT